MLVSRFSASKHVFLTKKIKNGNIANLRNLFWSEVTFFGWKGGRGRGGGEGGEARGVLGTKRMEWAGRFQK